MDALKLLEELVWHRDCSNTKMPPEYVPRTKFSDKNTNSFTRAVITWLKIHGCQAERVSNTGRYIQGKEVRRGMYGVIRTKGKFIKGTGQNGTSDVHSTIPVIINGNKIGLSAKWEIKCKYTKDKKRIEQVEYKEMVENAGGLVCFVRDFDEFVNKFHEIMDKYK